MNNLRPVLFFDLFFTLIAPTYDEKETEYDLCGSNELEDAKASGIRTIQTSYLIEGEKVKSLSADYYIKDFDTLIEIVNEGTL